MKKAFNLLTVALLFALLSGFVPGKEFTGTIVYNITYDNENMDPQMASFLPKTMKMTIKAPMSRSEISMGMGTTVSIFNADDSTGVNLMDMMGQKLAVRVSASEINKEIAKAGDVAVEKIDETKEILGYTCKKAVVRLNDQGEELTVYYTQELTTGMSSSSIPIFKDIDGLMLEFSMVQNGMNMHFTAVSIDKKKVSDSEFEVPEGYEEISQEELQKRFGM